MKKLLRKLKLVNHDGFLVSVRRPFGEGFFFLFSFYERPRILISTQPGKDKGLEFPFFNASTFSLPFIGHTPFH